VLLLLAVGEGVVLASVIGDLGHERDRGRALAGRLDDAEEAIEEFDQRILRIEGRTSGILNAAEVAERVLPSVVQVVAGDAVGTAFAVGETPRGGGTLLVTNYHVVEAVDKAGEKSVEIIRHERSYGAQIIETDPGRDLAILKTSRTFPRLDANQATLNAGDPVLVIGAPLGLSDTVTTGVVSAVREPVAGDVAAIQFDAAISPGNSGEGGRA
jgi:S1-C subfamily serine protease